MSSAPSAKPPPSPLPSYIVLPVLTFILFLIIIGIIGIVFVVKYRKETFIIKRRLSVVLGLNISFLCGMISSFCLIYAQFTENINSFAVCAVIGFISWFSIFLFLNVRHWYQYYQYKFHHYTLQLQWQQLINPNIVKKLHRNNWYIRHKKTYGNYYFIYKIFGIFHFCLLIICIAVVIIRVYQIGHIQIIKHLGTLNTICFLIPFIIYSIIICKTPSFNDIFDIHFESKIIAIITYLLIIGFLCGNITVTIKGAPTPQYTLIFATIRTIAYFLWLSVSTFFIIYKQTRYNDKRNNTFSKVPTNDENGEDITENNDNIELKDILENSDANHMFMMYLTKELRFIFL